MPNWPGKKPKPEGVVWPADRAVVVEVVAGRDACVRRRHVAEGVHDRRGPVLRAAQVVVLEALGGQALRVEVELVDEQDVRADALNDFGDDPRLGRVGRREFGDERPRGVPVQRRVEGREADLGRATTLRHGGTRRAGRECHHGERQRQHARGTKPKDVHHSTPGAQMTASSVPASTPPPRERAVKRTLADWSARGVAQEAA
jgi:hypothetical protein